MDPTRVSATITLNDTPVNLYWDFWAIRKFEQETGQHYMNWVTTLAKRSSLLSMEIELLRDIDKADVNFLDKMRFGELMGGIMSLTDFITIVWATHHTLTKPPQWPLSIEDVAAAVDQKTYLDHVLQVLKASCDAVRTRKKPDQPETAGAERPTNPSHQSSPESGGRTSGELDDAPSILLTRKSTT
jgi:hypothetical protein